MQPFITFREEDRNGKLQLYILQREFPHFVGMLTDRLINGRLQVPVTGHNLWIAFDGTLMGAFVPSYQRVYEEMAAAIGNMATWFYANRIEKDLKKYKKYKINVPSPNQ